MVHCCLICQDIDTSRRFLARDVHYNVAGEWWIRECATCESLFVENPPDGDELSRFYPEDAYYSYDIPKRSIWRRLAERVVGYARPPHEPAFTKPGSILDFGCGAGEALLRYKAMGWACAGVEISPGARERARQLGLDVRPTIRGVEGFAAASFDYVRANHSLEHVPNPAQTLADMLHVLKPGGTLFVGVPTATSQNARFFGAHWWHISAPLHLSIPSTRGLRELVSRCGFVVKQVRFNGDAAGTTGSLQIWLNRKSRRRSNQGIIFMLKPLLIIGDWVARVQDACGTGDKIELIAIKPRD